MIEEKYGGAFMKKARRFLISVLLSFAFCGMLYPSLGMADTQSKETAYPLATSSTGNEARGLWTYITISIGGGDGCVWGLMKNEFTLFPSVIVAHVELYSSETYTEDYTQMTLEGRNSTLDLNQGETLEIRASTGGKQKYWKARMRYKMDDRDWVEDETVSVLYGANGELLM